jgi:hypothetical protein
MSDELGQDTTTPEPREGIGRRTLIKRAAAAGAVAWTAPVILDSLASPAAAVSCAKCFKFGIQAVDKGNVNPTKTSTYPSRTYTVGSCLPNGDAKCATEKENTNFTDLGITLTNPFQVDLPSSSQVTVSMAQSGTYSGAGCNTPFRITGASFIWRSTSADTRFPGGNGDDGVCEPAKPGDSPTTGNPFPSNHLVSISTSSVTWTMPASLKPGHSGGFNFVIGCDCG